MKLDAFFSTIAPYLEGRSGHDETMAALYGAELPAHETDADRLRIYEQFCRVHRFEAVTVFHEARAAVIALAGEPAWEALVEEFFRAQPMRHFEINENAAGFASWLAEVASARGLPAWVAELADLDWWTWRAETVAVDDGDASAGPLRIAAAVELRPYRHDLIAWLDEEPRPPAPEETERIVIFWRDRDLDGRRDQASREELLVLKMVSEGLGARELAKLSGLPLERIDETVADLHEAGLLVGALPAVAAR